MLDSINLCECAIIITRILFCTLTSCAYSVCHVIKLSESECMSSLVEGNNIDSAGNP